MSWLSDLQRLQPLEKDLALIPVGWGNECKAPMFFGKDHPHTPEDWTKEALTVEQLQQWPREPFHAVGARTGVLTGPLLAFDFDGTTSVDLACQLAMEPWAVATWQVHRDNDPFRLKVLFRPTLEQIAQLPLNADGTPEFQGKTLTAPKTDTSKGEALEVFFAGGRQVILLGEHPSSGGNYFWPDGLGPEVFTAPPQDWWAHALQIAQNCQQRITAGSKPSAKRNSSRRLNPCPVCGRHSGPGGSGLWCEETTEGLILCMPGSTFSAEQAHGHIALGQVLNNGYALVKRTPIAEGDCLTFAPHRPREKPDMSPRHRRALDNLQKCRAGVTI